MKRKILNTLLVAGVMLAVGFMVYSCGMTKLSFANISVPEEGGINFLKITEDDDAVCFPTVNTSHQLINIGSSSGTAVGISWWVNPQVALSPDGQKIAYINNKNKMKNVMVKSSGSGGTSVQRTFRNAVTDFSWSPDGKNLCFTEFRNGHYGVYLVPAEQGSVVKQISTTSADDLSPVMSVDGKTIFFHRGEGYSTYSLWSFDIDKNQFSNYSRGMTPFLDAKNHNIIYCSRFTDKKECEVWKLNIETGTEEIILAQQGKSFSTPQISPDGKWILVTGSSITPQKVQNTDLFVIGTDGNNFTQLTYHPGNDLSGIWAPDGKSIYFISQRGATKPNVFNVWKMDFNL
jgi:Tol biopolymer transport system component